VGGDNYLISAAGLSDVLAGSITSLSVNLVLNSMFLLTMYLLSTSKRAGLEISQFLTRQL